jgi:hypothetical protein
LIGLIESKMKILGTSRRRLFMTFWLIFASFYGLMMRQG